jgi:phosphoribosyl 1,2-cyclic phosphodiesterase
MYCPHTGTSNLEKETGAARTTPENPGANRSGKLENAAIPITFRFAVILPRDNANPGKQTSRIGTSGPRSGIPAGNGMANTASSLGITILGSGSRGNAMVIHTPREALLIDAGFSARELRRRLDCTGLDPDRIKAVLVSHEHGDHVKGLRVFAGQFQIPIYANRRTADALRYRDDKFASMTIFAVGAPFRIGGFHIEPFSIPHDANDPVAFIVRAGDVKIGIATDLGHVSNLVAYQLRECRVLVLESNHDCVMLGNSKRPWALKQRIRRRHVHLSNDSCFELLRRVLHADTSHVVLAHASRDCNSYDLVKKGAEKLLCELERPDVDLHVAVQDEPLPTLWL